MSDAKRNYPPPPGLMNNWVQVDQNGIGIIQQYVNVNIGFPLNALQSTIRIPTGSPDTFVIATPMTASNLGNVKAVFVNPYNVGSEYGVDLTVTLINPAVAGEAAVVCLYQSGMNFS